MLPSAPQLILNTCPNQETAEAIATALVDRGLAACVNIVPGIQSIYRWQGKIEKENELMLFIKARGDAFSAVAECIVDLHPYELPEIVAVTIDNGTEQYLAWLNNPENKK